MSYIKILSHRYFIYIYIFLRYIVHRYFIDISATQCISTKWAISKSFFIDIYLIHYTKWYQPFSFRTSALSATACLLPEGGIRVSQLQVLHWSGKSSPETHGFLQVFSTSWGGFRWKYSCKPIQWLYGFQWFSEFLSLFLDDNNPCASALMFVSHVFDVVDLWKGNERNILCKI